MLQIRFSSQFLIRNYTSLSLLYRKFAQILIDYRTQYLNNTGSNSANTPADYLCFLSFFHSIQNNTNIGLGA